MWKSLFVRLIRDHLRVMNPKSADGDASSRSYGKDLVLISAAC
jgi:hypothetical protein